MTSRFGYKLFYICSIIHSFDCHRTFVVATKEHILCSCARQSLCFNYGFIYKYLKAVGRKQCIYQRLLIVPTGSCVLSLELSFNEKLITYQSSRKEKNSGMSKGWDQRKKRVCLLLFLLLAPVDLILIAWHWSNIPLCIADRCQLCVGCWVGVVWQYMAHERGWLGLSPHRDVWLIWMPISVIGMKQMLWFLTLAHLDCFSTGSS